MARFSFFILFLFAACFPRLDTKADYCEGVTPADPAYHECNDFPVDTDVDGYTVENGDCDDADPDVYPGAEEVCNDVDDDCNGETDDDPVNGDVWYADTDGDGYGDVGDEEKFCDVPSGYVNNANDCDDTDDEINPGAVEVCNDVDDDCDGDVDEDGLDTYFRDADGDGYGDAGDTTQGCGAAPEGYVANHTDCDDVNATTYPGADEVCNGVDDDCDVGVDEDAVNALYLYADVDRDGYGNAATEIRDCDVLTGYVTNATDCDDTDAAYHPGADESDCTDPADYNCDGSSGLTDGDGDGFAACEECDDTRADANPDAVEVCNDVDDDCDGDVDGDAVDLLSWYADEDGDGYGDAVTEIQACDAPTGYLADATDCDHTNADVYPGAVEVCNDVDDDCDGDVDGDAVDLLSWYADEDGDGYGDVTMSEVACDQPSGYVDTDDDCDDTDPAVYPGVSEVCNGADDDCDGDVDEDAVDVTASYVDADGDGYGDDATLSMVCEVAAGDVTTGGDCDDTNAEAFPGADELCGDTFDRDCDGAVPDTSDVDGDGFAACEDCDDSDASRMTSAALYPDADGDGYGDAAASTEDVCEGEPGYAAMGGDCDDTDAALTTYTTQFVDSDGDGYGDPAVGDSLVCGSLDGYVNDASDCDDTNAYVNPGATECSTAYDDDCDSATPEEHVDGVTTYYVNRQNCDLQFQELTVNLLDDESADFMTGTGCWTETTGTGALALTDYTWMLDALLYRTLPSVELPQGVIGGFDEVKVQCTVSGLTPETGYGIVMALGHDAAVEQTMLVRTSAGDSLEYSTQLGGAPAMVAGFYTTTAAETSITFDLWVGDSVDSPWVMTAAYVGPATCPARAVR